MNYFLILYLDNNKKVETSVWSLIIGVWRLEFGVLGLRRL